MPIPAFDEHGFLPQGVHDCTLQEVGARFGQFDHSDRRVRLFHELTEFVREASNTTLVTSIIIDGSFVTDEPEPNDIDLILVVRSDHDVLADLRPFEYNVLSKRRVRRRHGFDVLLARDESLLLEEYVAFFQRIRASAELRKGVLKVVL
jgi:hypothetical protein